MKYSFLILICLAFCLLSSCSSSLYSSPILASTNINSVPQHKALGRVESSDCDTYIFPFILLSSDFKKAYKNVFEQAENMGGDGIVNVQIRNKSSTFLLFYVSECYTLTGEAVKFTSGGGSSWDNSPEGEENSAWDEVPNAGENKSNTKSSWD